MKKIPGVFKRDRETRLVIDEVNDGCEWVADGLGVATLKLDGTSCMFRGGKMYKRRTVKPKKKAPDDFILCEFDENTGKSFGWVPVEKSDKYHMEGWGHLSSSEINDTTYELVGPMVQGGIESDYNVHTLVEHGSIEIPRVPRTYDGIREWLSNENVEGIVFHHADGRMAKIKSRDFGIDWSV